MYNSKALNKLVPCNVLLRGSSVFTLEVLPYALDFISFVIHCNSGGNKNDTNANTEFGFISTFKQIELQSPDCPDFDDN